MDGGFFDSIKSAPHLSSRVLGVENGSYHYHLRNIADLLLESNYASTSSKNRINPHIRIEK